MAHSWPSCLWLVLLSFVSLPYTLAHVVIALIKTTTTTSKRLPNPDNAHRVALVTGGRAQKAVYVTRALAKQGYRVVLAEERGWGEVCATRFSRSIARFYALPSGGGEAYVNALLSIAEREAISIFVPCSGVATAIEEADAAQRMRAKKIQTVIQDADLLSTLHEKDTFMTLVHDIGLDAPVAQMISSPEEGLAFLRAQGAHTSRRFLVKAATVPDDIGRADMTTYPFLKDGQPDWASTEKRLRFGLSIPISKQTPYLAQEFVGGPTTSEWCTHATVIDGKVKAFICCPSNDMVMTYHSATHTWIGNRALSWTQTFLHRLSKHATWHSTRLTGQFSFDFIYQPSTDRLVVIECNPRVHTAICLLQNDPRLGAALDGSLTLARPLMPDLRADPVSWLGHDLVVRRLARHPKQGDFAVSTKASGFPTYSLEAIGKDGAWSVEDPIVFLAFYHLQWPVLLLRQAFIRRKRFSRINVSTARIFEC